MRTMESPSLEQAISKFSTGILGDAQAELAEFLVVYIISFKSL